MKKTWLQILSFCLVLSSHSAFAELAVMIVADPSTQRLPLDGETRAITLTARANQPPDQLRFTWKRDGPGTFEGNLAESGIIYRLPATLPAQEADVTVTVIITNTQGETATARHILHLVTNAPPPPPPTPTPILPTPTPLPVQCAAEAKTLDELNHTLPTQLQRYEAFKREEQQGKDRRAPILETLQAIICDLQAIEQMLKQEFTQTPAIQTRIQRTQQTRQVYEQERLSRLNSEGR